MPSSHFPPPFPFLSPMLVALLLIVFPFPSSPLLTPVNEFSRGPLDYSQLLVDSSTASLYVGARGRLFRLYVYNVNDTSPDSVFAETSLDVDPADLKECESLGNSKDDCSTSPRSLFLIDRGSSLLVCSSSAQKPQLRVLDARSLQSRSPPSTQIGICATDPHINTTAVYVEKENARGVPSVYSGIRTGMALENHLIYRPPLTQGDREVAPSMRTVYTDSNWLNEPQFVGSFEEGEHVFFFFRELAVESSLPADEKLVFSRVARLCKKDVGGRIVLRQVWTSFVKARLNCSLSSQQPFYFDHIPREGVLFYASLSTSDTAFVSSAICSFSLKAINQLFEHGLFLEASPSGIWSPVLADSVPKHRPGTCVADSQQISDTELHWAKSHLIMADPVSGGEPILPTRDVVFHHVAVDVLDSQHVIFALDARSATLYKAAHWRSGSSWQWRLLSRDVLAGAGAVRAFALLPHEFFFVARRSGVSQFVLSDCSSLLSCERCAIDAFCAWNVGRGECLPREKSSEHSSGSVRLAFENALRWIASSPGGDVNECSTSGQSAVRKVFPGDSLLLPGIPNAVWTWNGGDLPSSLESARTEGGDLVLLRVEKAHEGVFECHFDSLLFAHFRVTVDEEECAQPKSVEAYRAAHRNWCRRLDGYKSAFSKWQRSSCPLGNSSDVRSQEPK